MAVMLRLARMGKHKGPFYRVVVTDKQNRRDGKFLEVVGTYSPKLNPAEVILKEEPIKKWLALGAKATEVVENMIKKQFPGIIEARQDHQRKKIQEARKKRKARVKAAVKKAVK